MDWKKKCLLAEEIVVGGRLSVVGRARDFHQHNLEVALAMANDALPMGDAHGGDNRRLRTVLPKTDNRRPRAFNLPYAIINFPENSWHIRSFA